MKLKLLLIILFIIVISPAFSKTLTTKKTDTPPIIDGFISQNEWAATDSAIGFIQIEPFKGQPATQKTVVYTAFDEQAVYVAFKCYTSNPDKIVANIRSRDLLTKNDDVVLVMFDTFHDGRTAYAFMINSLSTQIDFRIGDDGRNQDLNWDAEWNAAAARTDWGWFAEFAIPFRSIQYNPGVTTWGINFGRIIRSNSETVYWSGVMNDDFRVSQGGELKNIQNPIKESAFKATPYTTARYNDYSGQTHNSDWSTDFGGDFSYNITPGLSGNLTLNPDFATVEGDQEQINLTRWEIEFPEKRLFFLEGGELFNTRIKTFYSRRIGDIDYGANLVGKVSDYNVAVIHAKTAEDIPASIRPSNFTVMRIKRDILKSSSVGITAVDKSWQGGFTRSFSADYVLNLGSSWELTGQWASSIDGSDFLKNSAFFVRAARESNIYHYHFRYSDTGAHFLDNVNQTGYIKDDDMREIDSDAKYKWWLKNSLVKYFQAQTKNNIFWNHAGTLRSWLIKESFRIYMHNRLSFDFEYDDEFKLYEKKYYNNNKILTFGYNTDEWASAATSYTFGKNYDRDFTLIDGSIRIKPTDAVSLQYSFKKLDYSPDPAKASTILNILTVDYNFTRDLWIRVLTQNNTRDDRFYFYGLFAWRFKPPFGACYIIYTADENQPPDYHFKEKNNILFLKLSYQFQLSHL
ncbi:carbohydrate binding family 9 domain-containing protein [candidate division KSB1 bacterium]|nr:carbohydrate binding family 9 domain-containing protein [candidate division KSB1 bacterium]